MINEISTFILNKISSSMINDCLDIINNANDLRNRISARFFYDRLGRIVVSQNSRQQTQNRFSYSLYDALGRVVEAGEKTENTPGTNVLAFTQIFGAYVGGNLVPSVIDDTKLETWLNTQANNTRKEITRSYYDRTNTSILAQLPSNFTPDPLTQRKRIVHVTYEAVYDSNDATYNHATHYDYDIHGNVKTLLQDNADLGALNQLASQRFKRMDYTFDLISGNVHRVDYETNKADQWHHAYSYDADNRITAVYTTSATPLVNDALAMSSLQNEPLLNPTWEKEAAYSYYAHGPLARTVIGEQEVQGLDYVYTLQGWIKGVNSNNLDANNDPGKDGLGLSANHRVAQDVMGYSLHYFNNDYLPIVNGNTTFIADQSNSDMLQNSSDLYNGNIARMVTSITDPNSRAVLPLGNAYQYDQLNRLKHAVSFDQLNGNAWAGGAPAKYENSFTYDANGNILTQTRNDDNNQVIDELAYFYPKNAANNTVRNRLLYVSDNVDYDASDIDPGMATSNYTYDQEGRLIQDIQEQIASIEWRVDGKVKRINRIANSTKQNLSFDYDAMGHRIAKHVYTSANVLEKSTYYVLDATGNTMATYERAVDENTLQISYAQTEKFIYGSSRLGVQNCNIALLGSQNNTYTQTTVPHRIGKKGYELSNHLNNVLSVISDKVIPHSNGATVDYWQADILQSSDYSPFGVQLEGRKLKKTGLAEKFRYGIGGKEKDDEIKGEGNSLDFGARMYDPRVGRWLSLDPLYMRYPENSPYNYCSNNPIYFVDPDGRENIPALMWALNNMANKDIASDYSNPWYGSEEGGWVYKPGVIPNRIVCYESCWISYMNGASQTTLKTLKTGFSTANLGFNGRSSANGGENWFKKGNSTNGRQFVTDISKGQLGDIIFMGESAGMEGHAVMLASEIITESVEIDGVMVEQLKFTALSTSSDSDPENYGVRDFIFQKNTDGSYNQVGGAGYKFRGIGQMTNVTSTAAEKTKAKALVQEKASGQTEGDGTGEGSGSDGSVMDEDVD